MRRRGDGAIGQPKGHLTVLAAIQQQQHQNRFSGFFAVPIQERITTNTGIRTSSRALMKEGCSWAPAASSRFLGSGVGTRVSPAEPPNRLTFSAQRPPR